jgi:hypothetical protein
MRNIGVNRDTETVIKCVAIAVMLFGLQFVLAWWHGPIRTREECEVLDAVSQPEPNMRVLRDCSSYPSAKSLAGAEENAK